jgi:Zn-dependent M28 family amino/carboxypeptidase
MAKSKPQNTVRFAWWGAEELGLIGSTEWVGQRTPEELEQIALYLNFDMIGSPNYYFGVYDANESSFAAPVVVPDGSIDIEKTFEAFYTLRGEPYDDSAFSGRSDYAAFIDNGIPSGGLFTGAEERKTAQQQALWGGTTGAQFDPCYHLACDDDRQLRRSRVGGHRGCRGLLGLHVRRLHRGRQRCAWGQGARQLLACRRRLARSTRSPARWVATDHGHGHDHDRVSE